jgi:hypothetical protein
MNLKVIKNFLKYKDLQLINTLKLPKNVNNDGIAIYHNKITKDGKVDAELFDEDFLKSIHKTYHPIALNILKELSPKKINLYEYSEFHLVETGKDFSFPIHDDIPNKLLSGVIYLRPENNLGTSFFKSKNGNGEEIIDWEVNKAVFFSRIEKRTWHSYKGDGIHNRFTLVYNLMTDDIKNVYIIEGKNNILGRLRTFINPYLFKYFKFTI